jgi:hypothetical protein
MSTETFMQVLVGKPEGKRHLEDMGVDWTTILKCNKGTECKGVEWFKMSSRALVNTVMKRLVP